MGAEEHGSFLKRSEQGSILDMTIRQASKVSVSN